MKLYHFTRKESLMGIALKGLLPHVPHEMPAMTMNMAVVWLTKQTTLKPTQADLEWMQQRGDEGWEEFTEAIVTNRDLRLTINIPVVGKKLWHYSTWLKQSNLVAYRGDQILTGSDVAQLMTPTTRSDWFIYFGTIKPRMIDVEPTAGNLLPSAERLLANAIEVGDDADMIAHLTAVRDQLRSLPPEQPVI